MAYWTGVARIIRGVESAEVARRTGETHVQAGCGGIGTRRTAQGIGGAIWTIVTNGTGPT